MQIHQVKPRHKMKVRKRVGRGGCHGTYSGRGLKGQLSRAGRKLVPSIREFIKKYPKLKGYRARTNGDVSVIINIGDIAKKTTGLETITPWALIEKKLIRRIGGKVPSVKILGTGEIDRKITVEGCVVSKSAKEKIEKAGGVIKQ